MCACMCSAMVIGDGLSRRGSASASARARVAKGYCGSECECKCESECKCEYECKCKCKWECKCDRKCKSSDDGQRRCRVQDAAEDGEEDGDSELCTYLSGWESSPSGGSVSKCTATTVSVGLKFQCRTWIRCTIHVSILRTSYTDTKKNGTYHIVVSVSV